MHYFCALYVPFARTRLFGEAGAKPPGLGIWASLRAAAQKTGHLGVWIYAPHKGVLSFPQRNPGVWNPDAKNTI